MSMTHVAVTSSMIKSVAHDGDQTMHVKFNNGTVYEYTGVSADTHEELMSAASVGQHYNREIQGKFPSRKL